MVGPGKKREQEIRQAMTTALDDIAGGRSPLELVEEVPLIEAITAEIVDDRVAAARAQGLSWHAIAQTLGISRQAAHKRFGKRSKVGRRKGSSRIELRRT